MEKPLSGLALISHMPSKMEGFSESGAVSSWAQAVEPVENLVLSQIGSVHSPGGALSQIDSILS